MIDPSSRPGWGGHYWPLLLAFNFATFIGPEVYALATDWRNTLSNYVWWTLRVKRGQSVTDWTAAHFLIGGILLVAFAWLLGHLLFHIWASK